MSKIFKRFLSLIFVVLIFWGITGAKKISNDDMAVDLITCSEAYLENHVNLDNFKMKYGKENVKIKKQKKNYSSKKFNKNYKNVWYISGSYSWRDKKYKYSGLQNC